MRHIKIFYVVFGLGSGGIERYSINLLRNIDRSIVKMDFITKHAEKEFFEDVLYELGGVKKAIDEGCRKNKLLYKIDYVINALKLPTKKYDIAYFNISSPAAVFKYPLICRIKGIKNIIIHSHNSAEGNVGGIKKILNFLGRIYINRIATVKFACSEKAARWMFGKKCIEHKDYIYIKNGIDVDLYSYNVKIREKTRQSLSIKDDEYLIGHVGRFMTQKNHEFILDIIEQIIKENDKFKFALIGKGELQSYIELQAKERNLLSNIMFLGERKDIRDLLQAMDVFILPSLYEGLPVAGIEAQAAGLKCFFSDTITREADITGNIMFLPLKSDVWKTEIIKNINYNRMDTKDSIISAGYDIKSTAKQVEDIVINICND